MPAPPLNEMPHRLQVRVGQGRGLQTQDEEVMQDFVQRDTSTDAVRQNLLTAKSFRHSLAEAGHGRDVVVLARVHWYLLHPDVVD